MPTFAHAWKRGTHFEGAAWNDVEIRCETFESWPLERRAFDLIVAANAFHWIAPDARLVRAAQALRPNGALAIFRNDAVRGDSAVEAAVRLAAGRHAALLAAVQAAIAAHGNRMVIRYVAKLLLARAAPPR